MMKNYHILSLFVISAILVSLTVSTVFGQAIPSMNEISGKYTDDKVGLEIVFPDGWTGITMGVPEGSMATVFPGGMTSMNENSPTAMTLMVSEKTKADSPPKTFNDQGKLKCDIPSVSPKTVNGISATETTMSCTNTDGTVIKLKNISAETATHWIVVSFMAADSDYNNDIGKFDDSVNTLKIQNTVAVPEPVTTPSVPEPITTPPTDLQSSVMPVMVGDNQVELAIQSSSQLTNIGLDEANKKLSFTAVGDNDGVTIIPVGNVLEGEFVVMVDGQATTDFETLDEQGMQTLTLKYPSGSHDISISGTRVVPEFGSITILILVISLVSIIAISPKLRLLQKF
jgi:predicted secreted protein with PEFG-CTERM motif